MMKIVRTRRAINDLEAQMDRKSTDRRLNPLLPLLFLGALAFSMPLQLAAQVPIDDNGEPLQALDPFDYNEPAEPALQAFTAAELQDLVGPIALYPDDLLAIILPASTYPLEIVQAARFLDELATDSSLEPDESWDESIVALLNYPEVVYMMDKEIDWTWRLGEAVINQQADLLAAVESFRDRAYAAGNLESDEHQVVSNDDGVIEIAPADEEIIYVPYYEPEEVVIYQPRRVYHYYPHAYPVYYYPYPVGYSFASGYFWGVTTAYTIGWSNRYVHVYHPTYWGHPYYGRYYYGHYYRRPSITVYNNWYVYNTDQSTQTRHRDGDHWRPRKRGGARPQNRRVRNHQFPSDRRNRDDRRSVDRQAYVDRRSAQRHATNDSAHSRSDDTANRTRQSTSRDRTRTAVANRNTDRRERRSNNEIRFRDRSDTDTVSANRRNNPGQSSSSRHASNANNNATRQRLVTQNPRQANENTRARQNRQVSQRNTPTRQATATRTSSRNAASQRPASQRPASRPSVQRQAPAQRPASRPTVQRQAPAQRQASRPTSQRQSGNRQSSSSAKRSQSRNRTKRKN
jgi:hypothetical protein